MAGSHFNKSSVLVQSVPFSKHTLKKAIHLNGWKPMFILRNLIPPFPSINIKDKDLEETANKN